MMRSHAVVIMIHSFERRTRDLGSGTWRDAASVGVLGSCLVSEGGNPECPEHATGAVQELLADGVVHGDRIVGCLGGSLIALDLLQHGVYIGPQFLPRGGLGARQIRQAITSHPG
jgi:hypothetical protein